MAADLQDVSTVARAAELYAGAFTEGCGAVTPEFDQWAEAERGSLRSRYMSTLLRLCDAQVEAGETEESIATAQRLLAEDPLQEHVHRRLTEKYSHLENADVVEEARRLMSL